MRSRPTAAEERLMALRGRARGWRRAGWIDDGELRATEAASATPWKTFSFAPRAGLFLLTVLLAVAAGLLASLMARSAGLVVAGLLFIAAAEHLIARMGFFRTGIEEALWVVGLLIVVIETFDLTGSVLALAVWSAFVVGAALVALSIRLLHTLLFLCGVALVAFWCGEFFDSAQAAAWLLVAAGFGALLVHLAPAERPFRASASGWLALGAPLVAWALLRGDALAAAWAVAAACALLWTALGVRKRSRFALAGGALATAALIFELLETQPLDVEWKLILGGAIGLPTAMALLRLLREPRGGFTSQPLDRDAEPRLFELAAIVAVAPAPAQRGEGFAGEGGRFGGGGASGEY